MRNMKKNLIFVFGLFLIFGLIGCTSTPKNTAAMSSVVGAGELKVHFIDVGQADSILVQQGNSNMLIDAGNNGDAQTIKTYLNSQGVKSLDVVVGTHVHEDHIGSMDYIINSFQVGKVFFPKQASTTNTFKSFVNAVKNKGLKLTAPSVGSTFKIGEATITILAPNGSDYEDPNDYSIVLKVTFGNTSFLLTGDAEAVSESQMLSKGLDLSATVLKVGHHGSKSSTGQSFLDKVNPKYAVISVGKGNSYGHPAQRTMNRLKSKGIAVYRTDENGTIAATSDGNNVKFNTNQGSYNGIGSGSTKITTTQASSQDQSVTVYASKTGTKYHVGGCSSLSKSKIPISLSDAKSKGLTPCSKCNPPQ
ncbi:ComEC/Rec2 family competence protein [Clostridium estertheticum]|uniref:ComEC/Rec2 family competence protein n=1 Tax=Clostridium estertheticum TaxID=238834 RepID=UPI001CF5F8E6|nr:ComEC/Rec2 family competence protein [Clostridium estertheticum]MCB2361971.1 MBL fold metallo-hydrolase [Clostridium estertheticum]